MRTWKPLVAALCLFASPSVRLAQAVGEGVAPATAPQESQAPKEAAPQEPPGAQQTPAAQPGAEPDAVPFKQEELDQMLAPLALYPDSLLSQILMASTYPLEIVLADRWVKANKSKKGDALAKELEQQTWDASVKSLVNFPDVLASLSEKLEWTTKIGDAFLADQKAVMDTIQKLRAKAAEQGNLESNDKQTVTTEPAPAGSSTTTVIQIESADPEVVYVPTYNPTVVYGSWWYPSYPPPPPYYYPPAGAAFVGFACGVAWGYAWGDCDWGHGDVDIDIDQNFEFNQNIDRDKVKNEFNKRGGESGKWQHDSAHRRGTEYRDTATARKQGGASKAQATQSREAYRGRAESGREQLSTDRAAGRVDSQGRASSGTSGNRAGQTGQGSRSPQAGTRPSTGTSRAGSSSGSAFSRGGSGAEVQRQSNRGASSRSGGSRSGGSRGGASRGGRGGGGRR